MPDLDSSLRADAAAWHAETDAAYVGERGWAPASPPSRRPVPAIAAAVIVALIAFGAALAISRSGERASPPFASGSTLPTAPAEVDPLDGHTGLGGPDPSTAARVKIVPGAAEPGIVSAQWRLLGLRDGGRTLVVVYVVPGQCDQDVGFRVQQTTAAVELTYVVKRGNPTCFGADSHQAAGLIHLDSPLGERKLLHAPVSPKR